MAFCSNCGCKLVDGAKFCQKCGFSVKSRESDFAERQQEFVGKIYKCPNCGEILKSFVNNCPACGMELRGVKATSAVREFALKLEAIEARREYEKPTGKFNANESFFRITKTDEQKISLIKSFSIPNSKEDMLEFMILATSCINTGVYDFTKTKTKSEEEINTAWFSKVQQVYEKAKRVYSTDETFNEIKVLYDKCNEDIKKAKKKGIKKQLLMWGWIPIFLIVVFGGLAISAPHEEAKELERLDKITLDVQEALDAGEYKHALRIADSIDYQRYDVEMERKRDIQKEYWVDKVLEAAEKSGIQLEYTPSVDIDNANDKNSSDEKSGGGFVEGFMEGVQSGLDGAKENIEEAKEILNGK